MLCVVISYLQIRNNCITLIHMYGTVLNLVFRVQPKTIENCRNNNTCRYSIILRHTLDKIIKIARSWNISLT